jgi:hypothetical protein
MSSGCGVGWPRRITSTYQLDMPPVMLLASLVLADESIRHLNLSVLLNDRRRINDESPRAAP